MPVPDRISERVFVSYSRRDKAWLDRLQLQLAPLVASGVVDLWVDKGDIEAGDHYLEKIANGIDTSSAAILLVSADFQGSEFIAANELPRLRRYADSGELRLFWVPVSHCVLADELAQVYHTVGDPRTPLEELSKGQADRVLVEMARMINAHVAQARAIADENQRIERAREFEAAELERRTLENADAKNSTPIDASIVEPVIEDQARTPKQSSPVAWTPTGWVRWTIVAVSAVAIISFVVRHIVRTEFLISGWTVLFEFAGMAFWVPLWALPLVRCLSPRPRMPLWILFACIFAVHSAVLLLGIGLCVLMGNESGAGQAAFGASYAAAACASVAIPLFIDTFIATRNESGK